AAKEAKAKLASDARAKATEAKKKFDAAQAKADEAHKLAEAKRAAAASAKTVADKARTDSDGLAPKAQAARTAATAAAKQAMAPYALRVMPVVGFTADWAGPEAGEALRKGIYRRWIPNMLQVPERLVDWSLFVRTVQREYKGRFQDWVFWENPDLEQAPQSI